MVRLAGHNGGYWVRAAWNISRWELVERNVNNGTYQTDATWYMVSELRQYQPQGLSENGWFV